MILVSDYDIVVDIDRILIISFSVITCLVAWIISLLLLSKITSTEIKSTKIYYLGLGCFALFFGIGRFILFYHDYYAVDILDEPLWRLGNFFSLFGLTSLNFAIESSVISKTKKIITVNGLACMGLFLFLAKASATLMLYISAGILTLLPLAIYMYMAKISTGEVRKQAIFIVIGILLLLAAQIGIALLFNSGVISRTMSQFIAFLVIFVALVFTTIGFIRGPGSR